MKKYLALAALLLSGSVYANEEVVATSVDFDEDIVITKQDVKDAALVAQEGLNALISVIEENASEEQSK